MAHRKKEKKQMGPVWGGPKAVMSSNNQVGRGHSKPTTKPTVHGAAPTGSNKKSRARSRKKRKMEEAIFEATPWPPPRKIRVPKVPADAVHESGETISKYGMKESRDNLERHGLHRAVTKKSPQDVIDAWEKMTTAHSERPSQEAYDDGAFSFNGTKYSSSRKQVTRGLMVLRDGYQRKRFPGWLLPEQRKHTEGKPFGLEDALEHVAIGSIITRMVFEDGVGSAQKLAVLSVRAWKAVVNGTYVWDFTSGTFLSEQGSNGVLLVLNPETTITEMKIDCISHSVRELQIRPRRAEDEDKFREPLETQKRLVQGLILHSEIHAKWRLKNVQISGNIGSFPMMLTGEGIQKALTFAARALDNQDLIRQQNQFASSSSPIRVYQPMSFVEIQRLRYLLRQVASQRKTIKVLHFEKTPFLDRRILATIVRACPSITIIGIYDCPLLHLGDIICILDLIYEVNLERKKTGRALIQSLDFSPRFHSGMPFKHEHAATYGVTWAPHNIDLVQRGIFTILMKAFFKAKAMRLRLLFDEDKAFMHYFSRIPLPPLAVPSFLSALHRHLELNPKAKDYHNKRLQSIYDIRKPIRLGLTASFEQFYHDWPEKYLKQGKNLIFCSSCGYATLQDFFSRGQQHQNPVYRICAGCELQRLLDEEPDHLKTGKKVVLDTLFPEWKGLSFNRDAPLPHKANGILKLQSTVSVRPSPPGPKEDEFGDLVFPEYEEPLVRDNKCQCDSLQDLPTIDELVSDHCHELPMWREADKIAHNLDGYKAIMRANMEEKGAERFQNAHPFNSLRMDGGRQGQHDEHQPQRRTWCGYENVEDNLGYSEAMRLYRAMANRGW